MLCDVHSVLFISVNTFYADMPYVKYCLLHFGPLVINRHWTPNVCLNALSLQWLMLTLLFTASVVYWSEFLATEVPGSIPSANRFSEKQWGLERGPLTFDN
jgi:hypothetical protein